MTVATTLLALDIL